MSVSLSVLIPTHGRPRLLERTLESVVRCTLPDGYEELVVIENGSRAGAEELVEGVPERLNARYMHRERGNKSYALNEALDTIADGLIVFFDDDVQVHPEALVAYSDTAQEYGPGRFFGGPVGVQRKKALPETLAPLFPSSVRGYDLKDTRMGDKYLGFNWAAYSSDIKNLGGFDPRFGPGSSTGANGQESDMQQRLINAGCCGIDVPEALVWHYVPEETVSLTWLLRRRIQGGTRIGVELKASPREFAVRIMWQTLRSLGAAIKGAITLNWQKMAFVLCNMFQRFGVVKGYLWRYRN